MTTREQLGCEEVQALAGAFALGAVTPDESAAIQAHLENCADCRQELGQMVEVAMAMPLAVEAVEPPAGLRQRIVAAIAEDAAGDGIVSLPGAREARARQAESAADATPSQRRSFWTSRAWPALAAAALVAAVGLGGYSYSQQQSQPKVYALHVQADPQATGQLTYVPNQHTTYVTVDGAPDPGLGKTYQMWLVRDGKPESVGTIKPDPGGKADATLTKDLGGYQQFSVTVEPAGGSAQPTGAQVLTQSL